MKSVRNRNILSLAAEWPASAAKLRRLQTDSGLLRRSEAAVNVGREWTTTAHSVVKNGGSATCRCGSIRRTC
jgi:hypothetical protein